MEIHDGILEEMNPGEPYTAGELTSQFELHRRTVHNALTHLNELGKVERKKHSSRHVSWWLPCDE